MPARLPKHRRNHGGGAGDRQWESIAKRLLSDPISVDERQSQEVWSRIEANAELLDCDTWAPLLSAAAADIGRPGCPTYLDNWRHATPAYVLVCAVNWALEGNGRTSEVRKAAERVEELSKEVSGAAERLAALVRERDGLMSAHGLSAEWDGPNTDIWDLIERASSSFKDWASLCEEERSKFLRIASEQTRPGPELADVLDCVRTVHPAIVIATRSGDHASLEVRPGSAPDGQASRVRRFLHKLKLQGRTTSSGQHFGPLKWMSAKGIATLLNVVAHPLPDHWSFDEGAVRKNRERYLKTLKESKDKLGDSST